MSTYPAQIDNNSTLPAVIDNFSPVTGSTVNRLRTAILAIETELGVKPSSTYSTVKGRLDTVETTLNSIVSLGGIFVAGGDLDGTPINQIVIGIYGNPISSTTPSDGYLLTWNETDGYWEPLAPPISFIAGGDLTGTESNQTVIGIQDNPISDAPPSDGYLLTWSEIDGYWYPAPAPISFTAGGDLSGTESNQTVIGIQGNPINATLPDDGYLLTWSLLDGYWYPAPAPISFTAGGDLTGTESNQTVVSLTGADGYVLIPSAALAFGSAPSANGLIRTEYVASTSRVVIGTQASSLAERAIIKSGLDTTEFGDTTGTTILNGSTVYIRQGGNAVAEFATTYVSLVAPLQLSATNPSTTGDLRLANAQTIRMRSVANAYDLSLMDTDALDNLFIGTSPTFNINNQVSNINMYAAGAIALGKVGSTYQYLYADNNEFWKPIVGSSLGSSPYGVHGAGTQAMSDSDQTPIAAIYRFNTIITTGAITADRYLNLPISTDATAYTKIIDNTCTGDGYSIIVKGTDPGTTVSVLNGTKSIVLFDSRGATEISSSNYSSTVPVQYELSFVSGIFTTTSASFVRAGSRQINLSNYPENIGSLIRSITFCADMDKTSGATSVEVQLYDLDGYDIINTNLVGTSDTNTYYDSSALSIIPYDGYIRDDIARQYELQIKMNGGGGGDSVSITNGRLLISYAVPSVLALNSINPDNGPSYPGINTVSLYGTGFTVATTVELTDPLNGLYQAVTSVTYISSTELSIDTSAPLSGTDGLSSFKVIDGASESILTNCYTFTP